MLDALLAEQLEALELLDTYAQDFRELGRAGTSRFARRYQWRVYKTTREDLAP